MSIADRTPAELIEGQMKAHAAADAEEVARLRRLTLDERGPLIESACEAAAVIYRSRLAMGLPDIQPDPWPESTWEFQRKHAARACGRSSDERD
jgi:hypothetical protein